ncbi:MAG: O-antigen ligase family protein [Prolixibacteraceae bacterium]
MLEIICFLAITLFCIFQDDEHKIISLFLILLPFHTFLKNSFFYLFEGGEIFSVWKEAVILLLAYKVFSKTHMHLNRLIFVLQLLFCLIVVFYFLAAAVHADALPALRDHLFPAVLFFTVMAMKIDFNVVRKMILILAVSILISDIAGFAQYFFFNVPVARIMDTAAYVDGSGYIHYKISSYRIMGFERMAGITGSPNIFGLFNAFSIILFFGVLLFKESFSFSVKEWRFIRIVLFLSLVSIVFSFSRAGWAIAFLGTGIMLLYKNFHIRLKYLLGSILIMLIMVLMISILYPGAFDIISNSFSGREASAAARGNSVLKGIRMLLDEPWGHGLGATDNRKESVQFFVESAWMNIGYEIGLAGVFYLITVHLLVLYYLLKHAPYHALTRIAAAIAASTLVACMVSVNPYGMPYIYLWWFLSGLGINAGLFLKYSGQGNFKPSVVKWTS